MSELAPLHEFNVPRDAWVPLQEYTAARIALGRTGTSIPLRESLDFKLAHAHARDAVYSILHVDKLRSELESMGLPVYNLKSTVQTRKEYLQRPDLGRRLQEASIKLLQEPPGIPSDVSIILADGLSASAINDHAVPLLRHLIPALQGAQLKLSPLIIAEQGRVALADEIGSLLQSQLTVMLIGERPGLSSPNSMGAYLTYKPSIGLTDESRNCVSNIRPEGLNYKQASEKLFYLVQESLRRKVSGISLKDNANLITNKKHA